MAETLSQFFVNPKTLPEGIFGSIQVLFLGVVYGKILFDASNQISDGSELLLLIPSLAGIVGSVVLPVLGAVPDGAIVLFSGFGPNAQEQLSVGVGALAGSTIMLLTLPWALSVYAGRVNLENGKANYRRPRGALMKHWAKLMPANNRHLSSTGIVVGPEIAINGMMMMLTALIYLVIQIPAYQSTGFQAEDALVDISTVVKQERFYAYVGFILCCISFVGYLVWNVQRASTIANDVVGEIQIEGIRKKEVSLSAVMGTSALRSMAKRLSISSADGREYGTIPDTAVSCEDREHLEQVLKPFFKKYDLNKDGKMDKHEVYFFFNDLNESVSKDRVDNWFDETDEDHNGFIEFPELVDSTLRLLQGKGHQTTSPFGSSFHESFGVNEEETGGEHEQENEEEDEEEEEEDMPEDLIGLSVEDQQYKIKCRAMMKMCCGTFLVLMFSDPMVDILSEVGTRTSIPAFYVSFIIAPLASNASELIASYNYAKKKTSKTISISIAALLGAACMNNTFCLGIFMALMAFKPEGLAWEYSAETITILVIEFIMGYIALQRTQTLGHALCVFSLFPLSMVFIVFLENVLGFD